MPLGPSAELRDIWMARMLRLFGLMDFIAVLAVVLPRGSLAAINDWCGLEPLPEVPVVEYLARSGSLMYALHGAMLIFVSFDVPRYRTLIGFLACSAIVQGAILYTIDWALPMPTWWKTIEGGCIAATGVVLLTLRRPGRDDPERRV